VRVLTPSAREEIRAQTVVLDDVVIEILDAATRQSVYPTQVVPREGQATRRVTLTDVPVGNLLVRLQGRANGEAAGTRADVPVTITANQVSTISADLNPVHDQTGLQLSPSSLALNVGGSQQLQALAVFSDLTTEPATNVTWSSANPAVANVSSTGLVTGRAAGNTSITATSGNFTASAPVTVTEVALVRLDVTPTGQSLETGGTRQFTATGTFANNSTQDLTNSVTWRSLQPDVASISATGLATGQAPGTATIIAERGAVSGGAQLTVINPPLTALQVVPSSATLVRGTTVQLGAQARFGSGSFQNVTGQVTWTSSNVAVATVSAQGLVSGVSRGQVNVTASLGNQTAQAVLNVTDPTLTNIVISPSNGTLVNGTTRQYTARGTFSDGSTQDITQSVTWSSTNTSVLTIENGAGVQGLATARGLGSTLIEATQAAISGSVAVNVAAPTLQSIEVRPITPRVLVGSAVNFTALGTFDNGLTQDITEQVAWASSAPTVAVVSNVNGTKGQTQTLSAGAAAISASFNGQTGSQALFVDPVVGPPAPSPTPPRAVYLTATFAAVDEILVYPAPFADATLPTRKFTDPGLNNSTQQISLDGTRDILYCAVQNANQIRIYQPASTINGTTGPARIISGPDTGLAGSGCRALVIDPANDRLYVGLQFGGGAGSIVVFDNASTLNGEAAFNRRIDPGTAGNPSSISYLSFDPVAGRLFGSVIVGGTQHQMKSWDNAGTLNGASAANRSVDGWNSLQGLFVDGGNDRLYCADSGLNQVRVLPASTANGPVNGTSIATMDAGAFPGGSDFTDPIDVRVDLSTNELLVADGGVNRIQVYANASAIAGNQAVVRFATTANNPRSLALP